MSTHKLIVVVSLIFAISLTAGCSLFKPNKEPLPPKSSDSAASDKKPEPMVNSDSEPEPVYEAMSDNEVCEMICGFYVNKSYFNEFEKTKSARSTQSIGKSVYVFMDEETGKYSIMQGDMHQGNRACVLTDVSFDKSANTYSLFFEPYIEGYETVLTYNDTAKTYNYKGFGTTEPVDEEFLRFDNYYKHKEYLAYLVLKDSPDVTVDGHRIYADVNGIRKYIEISSDATFDSLEASKAGERGALGYVSLREEDVEDFEFFYYTIENNIMSVKDDELKDILTLRLSQE